MGKLEIWIYFSPIRNIGKRNSSGSYDDDSKRKPSKELCLYSEKGVCMYVCVSSRLRQVIAENLVSKLWYRFLLWMFAIGCLAKVTPPFLCVHNKEKRQKLCFATMLCTVVISFAVPSSRIPQAGGYRSTTKKKHIEKRVTTTSQKSWRPIKQVVCSTLKGENSLTHTSERVWRK